MTRTGSIQVQSGLPLHSQVVTTAAVQPRTREKQKPSCAAKELGNEEASLVTRSAVALLELFFISFC
jgi:hypothetical protein